MATSPSYSREYAYYFKGKKIVIVEKDYNNSTSLSYGKFKSPNKHIEDGLQIEYVYKPFAVLEDPTRWHLIKEINDYASGQDVNSEGSDYANMIEVAIKDLHTDVTDDYNLGDHVYLRHTSYNQGLYQVRDKDYLATYTRVLLRKIADVNTPLELKDINQASVSSDDQWPMLIYPNVKRIGDPNTDLPYDDYLCTALVYYVKARLAEDMGNIEGKEYFMREFLKRISINENAKVAGLRLISPGIHAIK